MPLPADAQPSSVARAHASSTTSRGRAPETTFWTALCLLGAFIGLVTLESIGKTSIAAIVLQVAAAIWIAALLLRMYRHRLAYAAAGAWVLLLWLPMCAQVIRRLHYWVTIGMEPPDGMGSPLAFMMGLIFELLVFLPLTGLLIDLVLLKPWRSGRRIRKRDPCL
ncbi:hypothetical protein Mal64_11650 [Pseudobythopirellula maris]|uniref:Uncharacterized protein n=1 Tax=Pseudobythopirellula maris TaxID=2527991 RepID=A0A5C5ZUP2_9BACT|nr:hypothetical protein [Pseudobythopirellula maris]TWT90768.1 hypothetical protein Mal64_11650 [Pseudobythopirellula maris]